MRDFDEFMRDNFDAHLGVVTEAGGVRRARARSVVAAIKRRRAVRAGTATGVSVLTIGALALGAMHLGPATAIPSMGFPAPPPGSPSWCDLNSYPQVNPDALGASAYDGRVYADYVRSLFVYVARDGSHHILKPDANGDIATVPADGAARFFVPFDIPDLTRVAWDISPGSGWSGDDLDGLHDQQLLYEWTTTVPETVPAGVDVEELSQVLVSSLGFGGTGFRSSAVPDGAVVETIYRWSDGHIRTVKVIKESFGGRLRDYAGIASVSVRVSNLPDGETFEITSTYDPTKTWAAACTAGVPRPTPTETAPVATPYLEGPESEVFQCLAPLPAEAEDAIQGKVKVEAGVQTIPDSGVTYDFGPRGIFVTSSEEIYDIAPGLVEPTAPGWTPDWGSTELGGAMRGALVFAALGWVDADNVLVGREVSTPDPDGLLYIGDPTGVWGGASVGHHQFSYIVGDVDSLGVPCPGADPGALDSASLVWLEGYGPDAGHMTWSWTRVVPSPQN